MGSIGKDTHGWEIGIGRWNNHNTPERGGGSSMRFGTVDDFVNFLNTHLPSVGGIFESLRINDLGGGSYNVGWNNESEQTEGWGITITSSGFLADVGGIISNSNPLTWINTGLGFASLNYGLRANFLRQNELWHYSKNGNLHHRFEKSWNKGKFKNVRTHQTRHLAKARGVSNGLAWVALGTTGVNIYQTGQVKASDVLYASMAAASFTGVGSIVAGVFFIADLGVMAHSYISSGGKQVKNTGDYLDDYFDGGVIYDHNN
jgi:hypothetical protein